MSCMMHAHDAWCAWVFSLATMRSRADVPCIYSCTTTAICCTFHIPTPWPKKLWPTAISDNSTMSQSDIYLLAYWAVNKPAFTGHNKRPYCVHENNHLHTNVIVKSCSIIQVKQGTPDMNTISSAVLICSARLGFVCTQTQRHSDGMY